MAKARSLRTSRWITVRIHLENIPVDPRKLTKKHPKVTRVSFTVDGSRRVYVIMANGKPRIPTAAESAALERTFGARSTRKRRSR
jgi:hypothetical protein